MLRIVILSQIPHPLGLTDGVILTSHMVGYEVDDHLHASLMRAFHELFKLQHTQIHVRRQIRVNIIIIGDGIGRARLSLHYSRMVHGNTMIRIVGLRRMSDHPCIPNMTDTHVPDLLQNRRCQVIQFTAAVLFDRAVLLPRSIPVSI